MPRLACCCGVLGGIEFSRGIVISRNFVHQQPAYQSRNTYSTRPTALPDPRWLHDFRARVGRCINFGLRPDQVERVGQLTKEVTADWRALLAGAEGFLTHPSRAGMLRHAVQWGDQDSMGHVNNVVYNRWSESGRVNWIQNYARSIDPANSKQWQELATPVGKGMILRSIKTDFKFPMKYPDRLSVFHKLVSAVTEKSDAFVLDVVILSEKERRISARLFEDIALYDYQAAKKMRMEQLPFMMKAFQQTLQAQQEESSRCIAQRQTLTGALREIERASWDRPDAKEDFGSGTP